MLRGIVERALGWLVIILFFPALALIAMLFSLLGQKTPFERWEFSELNCEVWRFKIEGMSWVGEFLEKWSIDFWPAFWNAASGEVRTTDVIRHLRKRNGLE